ncbi:PA0069 family radical SAM protein [Frigidibacter sp. MR17.14]|uniref:PA0069 family radical SAM protein n=1 Tax=Frigidibacter sp. MR17.14 TaxID=3126509 RepID=UPI003012BA35
MPAPHPTRPLPAADPALRLRARGAGANPVSRFDPYVREVEADGWDLPVEDQLARTEVSFERPRSALTRNDSPDVPFDRSVNPYRGCEHGCIYCFARPSHAYLGLSPGVDFETKLTARPSIPEVLAKELSRKGYRPAPIALGTNTDPYQPIEARHRIMRGILQVLSDFRHPVTIVTKGAMIERDLDLLAPMAAAGLAHVGISVTTLDPDLCRRLEPRAPSPQRRIAAIRTLAAAGVPVRVMASPIIPVLTDAEGEAILAAAAEAGATAASWILLRLPHEVAPLFVDWLRRNYPGKAEHVMSRLRAMRGGRANDPRFTSRMRGEGPEAEMLHLRMRVAAKRLGLEKERRALDCSQFRVPPKAGDQLSLF